MLVTKKLEKTGRRFAVLLVLSISLLIIQKNGYADLLDQTAENYRIKGYEAQQKGNYEKALTAYLKSIAIKEDNAPVYNDLGVVYEQLGIPDKAEKYYIKAINYDSQYLSPYTNLAYLYWDQGHHDKAIKYFEERIKRAEPNDPWVAYIKSELCKIDPNWEKEKKKKDIKKEIEVLSSEVIRKVQHDFALEIIRSDNHYKKGKQYLSSKDYEKAIREFDRALIVTPDNPKILKAREAAEYEKKIEHVKNITNKAIKRLDLGELESAKQEFQKILTIIPNKPIQESE